MDETNRSRMRDALAELSSYRDEGEDLIDNIDFVAEEHSVPVSKLRELAERKWGGPLETDRERNAEHFAAAAEVIALRAKAHAYRNEIIVKAKAAAIGVWENCCPNGEPDWNYCAQNFINKNRVEGEDLVTEIKNLFSRVGSDFRKAVSLYTRWAR